MALREATHFKGPIISLNGFESGTGLNLALNSGISGSDLAGKTVRINSVSNAGTANSLIGFQSKPGQAASMANNVIGAEISPRLNDAVALTGSGSIIGLHVDAYLRGTSGNIAGDVRALQLELVDDAGSVRTVAGDEVGIRLRLAAEHAVTGDVAAVKVEPGEKSLKWDAVMKLSGAEAGIWGETLAASTAAGFIKVLVNGAVRYIQLYSGAPA